jgi:predicted MFS family arabinose efflux permease
MMSARIEGNAGAEWRAHWTVVLAACAGFGASTIISYSSSLFIQPLQHDFGWSRAQIMSGHSIASVTGVIAAPFTGMLVDRIGPRRLGIFAVAAICLATALFSLAGPDIWMWRALWVPMSLAIVIIQPSVWTAAITSLFSAGRGLALAVILCGGSLSSIVTPPLTYFLIEQYGWRVAWIGIAAFWATLALPLIWLFFTSAKDSARRSSTPATVAPPRRSLRESGMLTRRYAQLLVGGVGIAAVVVTLGTSLVPVLSSNGLTRGQAAGIASLLGVSAIIGRLGIGALLDRIHGRYLAAFCVLLPIVGVLILIHFPGSIPAASVAVLIIGFSLGAELDIIAYLTSRYFRLENFGFLFGTIAGFLGLAASNGPVLLNAVFDATGSYIPALWAAIPICGVAALLFLLLGAYPDADRSVPAGH